MRTTTATPTVDAFDHRSVVRYTIITTVLGLAIMAAPALVDQPSEVGALVMTYGLLLGGSVITARRAGPGGVRRLFSGLLRWRIGWANAAVVLAAIPLATIGIAAVTGTYVAPEAGWLPVIGSYLFTTFVFGALLLNLWEETGWQGLVQRHFTGRYGLLRGAGLTAIPFAIIHIPLTVADTSGAAEMAAWTLGLFLVAPAMRYLLGRTDYATGGSLLAVGVLHASFNASGNLTVVDGAWQYAAGLLIVAAAALTVDVLRARSHSGVLAERRAPSLA
jgi:membrane protease YdiL (CAAX protease family)